MNQYGRLTQAYYQTYLPSRLAAIPEAEREAFFTARGEAIEQEIQTQAEGMAGPDPEGEDFLEKLARLNVARKRAEEMVLAEMLYQEKEPGTEDAEMVGDPVPGVTYPE